MDEQYLNECLMEDMKEMSINTMFGMDYLGMYIKHKNLAEVQYDPKRVKVHKDLSLHYLKIYNLWMDWYDEKRVYWNKKINRQNELSRIINVKWIFIVWTIFKIWGWKMNNEFMNNMFFEKSVVWEIEDQRWENDGIKTLFGIKWH